MQRAVCWQRQAGGSVQCRAAAGSTPVAARSVQRSVQCSVQCGGTLRAAAETRRTASAGPCTRGQPLSSPAARRDVVPGAKPGHSQQPGASREGTRWWPPSVTAVASGTLGAARTSQHPSEHQPQQGSEAAAKAANACPGASAGAGTGDKCHRRLARLPRGSPYLDAFRASVQGVHPAACALPAPRAAGRGHAARAAQAAAVATCAERGDAVRALSPMAGLGDTAVVRPCPAGATATSWYMSPGRVPAAHAHRTCKGFPQHPDLLRGSRRGRSALRRREVGRAHVSPAGPLVAEQREQPSGMRGSTRLGLHRCGTGRSDPWPWGPSLPHAGKTPQRRCGVPGRGHAQGCQCCPGGLSLSEQLAQGDGDQPRDPILQGPPSLPPTRDRPVEGCPSAPAQHRQGTGTMSSLCGAGWGHDLVHGSKGSQANLGSGDQGPHPTVPQPRRRWPCPCGCLHPSRGGHRGRVGPGIRCRTPMLPRVPHGSQRHMGDRAAGERTWPSRQGTAQGFTPKAPLLHRLTVPPASARSCSHQGRLGTPSAEPGVLKQHQMRWTTALRGPALPQPRHQLLRSPAQPGPATSHKVRGIATPPLPRPFSFIKPLAPLAAGP